jgi:hypothetical protein
VFLGVIKLSYLWLQEQAKKALESALGGKKDEFEKWNKEIKGRFWWRRLVWMGWTIWLVQW